MTGAAHFQMKKNMGWRSISFSLTCALRFRSASLCNPSQGNDRSEGSLGADILSGDRSDKIPVLLGGIL